MFVWKDSNHGNLRADFGILNGKKVKPNVFVFLLYNNDNLLEVEDYSLEVIISTV